MSANNILTALEGNELDVGILAMPTRVPRTLRITYSFRDRFCLVAPNNPEYEPPHSKDSRSWKRWVEAQNWLLLDESSSTGRRIGKWLKEHRWQIEPVMQFDNFELILHLVAMGMGVSLVPIRSLALFGRKGNIRRIPLKRSFERELIVLVRKHRKMPDHLKQFVDHILF